MNKQMVKLVDAKIERETEKAALVEATVMFGSKYSSRKVWFPKSQIEIDESGITASAWILSQKKEQIVNELWDSRGQQMAMAFGGFLTEAI